MSNDFNPEFVGRIPEEPTPEPLPATKLYPICPECGCNTIVLYTPPHEGLVGTEKGYRLYHERNWNEYVDWSKAHLYCCNGQTNCDVNIPIFDGLTTPVKERRRRFVEVEDVR